MRMELEIPGEVWETRNRALNTALLLAGVEATKTGNKELAREVLLASLAYQDLLQTLIDGILAVLPPKPQHDQT